MLTILKEIKGLRINRLSLPLAQRYRTKLKSKHMLQWCQQNWHCLAYFQPSQGTRRISDRSRVRKANVPRQEADGQGGEGGWSKQASTLWEGHIAGSWDMNTRPQTWLSKLHTKGGSSQGIKCQETSFAPKCLPLSQHAMVLLWTYQVILTSKEERWKHALSVLV